MEAQQVRDPSSHHVQQVLSGEEKALAVAAAPCSLFFDETSRAREAHCCNWPGFAVPEASVFDHLGRCHVVKDCETSFLSLSFRCRASANPGHDLSARLLLTSPSSVFAKFAVSVLAQHS